MSSAGSAVETAQIWIDRLDMQPHPEGGHYCRSYLASESLAESALPARYPGARPTGSAIHFLLQASERSVFHRLRSDELWHFYAGAPLAIHEFPHTGGYRQHLLGQDWRRGQRFQVVIPHGGWFGAELLRPAADSWTLVGATVAPGFDFADFELADPHALLREYGGQQEVLRRFYPDLGPLSADSP